MWCSCVVWCHLAQEWEAGCYPDFEVPSNWSPFPLETEFGGTCTTASPLGLRHLLAVRAR
jgi:hypothetical protein